MKDARRVVEEFWDLVESRCAFDLKNRRHLEGYIFQVEEETIVFGNGGPLAAEEDEIIPIEAIDLSTLYFWSDRQRCYVHAVRNMERNEWELTPS